LKFSSDLIAASAAFRAAVASRDDAAAMIALTVMNRAERLRLGCKDRIEAHEASMHVRA
jgi:hypothetical protein